MASSTTVEFGSRFSSGRANFREMLSNRILLRPLRVRLLTGLLTVAEADLRAVHRGDPELSAALCRLLPHRGSLASILGVSNAVAVRWCPVFAATGADEHGLVRHRAAAGHLLRRSGGGPGHVGPPVGLSIRIGDGDLRGCTEGGGQAVLELCRPRQAGKLGGSVFITLFRAYAGELVRSDHAKAGCYCHSRTIWDQMAGALKIVLAPAALHPDALDTSAPLHLPAVLPEHFPDHPALSCVHHQLLRIGRLWICALRTRCTC